MTLDRRTFLSGLALAGAAHLASRDHVGAQEEGSGRGGRAGAVAPSDPSPSDRFDPWVEVFPGALAHNVEVVSRLTEGRPILAVIKNNAYGLGLVETARLLGVHEAIAGFAVVKAEDALALRDAGIDHPVLLMGYAPDQAVAELVGRRVHLSLYLDDDPERLPARAGATRGGGPIPAHVYLDTGMSRMGMPWHRAIPWLERVAASGAFRVDGTYTAFTEDPDFDPEQLRRFREVAGGARSRGIELGRLHAASSNGVYHLPDAHLDMVRPGIALFGGYPSRPEEERARAVLEPAVALRCRVVRVERLRAGDGVSYGRSWVAERPVWVATLPVGHADGYPRGAVKGARVAIGGATCPVIGAVSASHTIVEVGEERRVAVGDVATLVGLDAAETRPNEVARASEASVYDVFMHLNPALPRRTG